MLFLRNAFTVGLWVLASRFLGFARDILIAGAIGTGWVADAWAVAFRFPNLFRRLLGEGAFNAAFTPMYAKRLEGEGPVAARRLAEEILSVMMPVLFVLTALLMLFMPFVMTVYAPGFSSDPVKYDLAVALTQIALPYLLFMSLFALYAGVLNTHGRFAAATGAQVLLNVCAIAGAVFAWTVLDPGLGSPVWGYTLAYSCTAAGALQLLFLVAALARGGMELKLHRPRLSDDAKRLFRLMVPGIVAGGVSQMSIFIATLVATLQAGAPAILYYADRIYQFPLGIVGTALGIVLLPSLARYLRAGEMGHAQYWQNRAVELGMLFALPAAAALITISFPIAIALFERGAFTRESSMAVGQVLIAFGAGLPAFILNKVLSPAYFAREDTATPMRFAIITLCLDVTLGVSLFFMIGVAGIAIGTATTAWINAGLLGFTLLRRGHWVIDARLKDRLWRIAAAAALMGAALVALELLFASWVFAGGGRSLVAVTGLCGIGLGLYAAACLALRATTIRELAEQLRRKPGLAPQAAAED